MKTVRAGWCVALCISAGLTPLSALAGPPPWWDAAWPCRVRIECDAGAGDVAWVRLTLAGRTTADGRDLRLVDADGTLRGFEILHHDPRLETLIQLRVPPDQSLKTWLYFGNADARPIDTLNPQFETWQKEWNAWKQRDQQRQKALRARRAKEQELERLRAAAGVEPASAAERQGRERRIAQLERELAELEVPEAGVAPEKPATWSPRRGIVLRVYRKRDMGHPGSLTELRRLIRRSALEGACFCRNISDGFNRFGPSEHYISVYEGWLRIDQPGEYRFCTVSDDGSWVRVDDKDLVAWPGPHGWEGAQHGEKHGAITLRPGVVSVQYFHEEGSGGQMAFLGWQPPGAERFWSIPDEQWLDVRQARVVAYEARDRPLIAVPALRIVNTYWVRDADDRQATLVEFRDRSRSSAGKIVRAQWSFGDGLEAEGPELRHVYFRTGRPEVTLTVTDERGNRDTVACCPNVFYVDVQARYFQFGSPRQYMEAAAGYDVERMQREDLQLYAEFWDYLEQWSEHVRAVEALIRRFPDLPAVPELAASAARACMRAQAYDPQRAAELYELALHRGPDSAAPEHHARRLELTLRQAEALAWGPGQFERSRKLLSEVLGACEGRSEPPFPRIRRQALSAAGDAALLAGDYVAAERCYRQAQESGPPVEPGEMLARVGSYGYAVADLLARDEYDWALEALDRWEGEFPVQKLEGYTFFLRGKVLYVQHPGELALRYLDLAERVAPRAVHVPEAVWLRANCLLALQRWDEALAAFQRVRTEFTESEFYQQAAEKIEACRSRRQ